MTDYPRFQLEDRGHGHTQTNKGNSHQSHRYGFAILNLIFTSKWWFVIYHTILNNQGLLISFNDTFVATGYICHLLLDIQYTLTKRMTSQESTFLDDWLSEIFKLSSRPPVPSGQIGIKLEAVLGIVTDHHKSGRLRYTPRTSWRRNKWVVGVLIPSHATINLRVNHQSIFFSPHNRLLVGSIRHHQHRR